MWWAEAGGSAKDKQQRVVSYTMASLMANVEAYPAFLRRLGITELSNFFRYGGGGEQFMFAVRVWGTGGQPRGGGV